MDGETKGTEVELALEDIDPRPGNRPARNVDELAESLRREGQLNAIIVRAKGRRFELIAGERRCAAAEKAGFTRLRARIVQADDAKAEILAAVDNLDREDLSPLEEAEVYDQLAKKGMVHTEIGRRLGRSPQLVSQRIRLLELVPEIRGLVDRQRLDLGAAELLAQAPQAVQRKLLPRLKAAAANEDRPRANGSGLVPIARSLVRELLEEHTHDLRSAPFDTADTTMPGGGCGACPRRTGTQGALFGVLEAADQCLDDACWRKNVDEVWARKSEAAKRTGMVVLDERKSQRVLDAYGYALSGSGMVRLDSTRWVKDRSVPVEKLVGPETPRTMARHPKTGEPVLLVPAAEVEAAATAREKKGEKSTAQKGPAGKADAETDAQREARKHEATALSQKTHAIAIAQIAGALKAKRVDGDVAIRALVASVLHLVNEDARRQVCKRRNIEPTGSSSDGYRYLAALQMELAHVGKSETAMVELGLEVAAADRISFTAYGTQSVPDDFEAFNVDIKACRKEAERLIRDEQKAKAEKKAAPPGAKKPAAAKKKRAADVPF